MKIVGPVDFDAALRSALKQHAREIQKTWSGPKTEFSAVMLKKVFAETAKRLGLTAYPYDYYTLDCIFYEDRDTTHFPENAVYANYIAVAIEHENYLADTCHEMNKLQLFNVPLKVLITYARAGYGLESFLIKYEAIIKSSDVFGDVASARKQLVVFGDRQGDFPTWRSFVYKENGFSEITPVAPTDEPANRASGRNVDKDA